MDLTMGMYQLKLAPAYIRDKLQKEQAEKFQIDELLDERELIKGGFYLVGSKKLIFSFLLYRTDIRSKNSLKNILVAICRIREVIGRRRECCGIPENSAQRGN